MFNFFDFLAPAFVIFAIMFGYWTGTSRSFFYVFSILSGIWLARVLIMQSELGFYMIFFVCVVLINIIGFITKLSLPKASGEGSLDRIGGAMGGALLGFLLIITLVIPLLARFNPQSDKKIAHSFVQSKIIHEVTTAFPDLKHFDVSHFKSFTLENILKAMSLNVTPLEHKLTDSFSNTAKKVKIAEDDVHGQK